MYYTKKISAERFDSSIGMWVDWFVRTTENQVDIYVKFLREEKGFRNIKICNI